MENNTNIENNKKKYILIGAIAIVVIVSIILAITLGGKTSNTPTDEVNQEEVITEPYVSPHLYAAIKLNNSPGVVEKAGYLYDLYQWDNITKEYKNHIGKEFLNKLTLKDIAGKTVDVTPGNKKILIFTKGDEENYYDYEAYLYLGALAKDVDAYDLYLIDTDLETMADFSDNFNGHLLNNPTPEEMEFLEYYPDDFILFIDENNIIECISGLMDVNDVSRGGGYVFSTNHPAYEYIRLFEEYESDPDAAMEEYYLYSEESSVIKYNSVSEINADYFTHFFAIEGGSFLNERILESSGELEFINGEIVSAKFSDTKDREFFINQGDGFNSIILNPDDFNYYSTMKTNGNIEVFLYGNSQDDITEFLFCKNNVKVHIGSNKGWTKEEIALIFENF